MTIDKYIVQIDYVSASMVAIEDINASKEVVTSILHDMFNTATIHFTDVPVPPINAPRLEFEIILADRAYYEIGMCEKIIRQLRTEAPILFIKVEAITFHDSPLINETIDRTTGDGWLVLGTAVWYKSEDMTTETAMPVQFITTHLSYIGNGDMLGKSRMTHLLIRNGIALFKNTGERIYHTYHYGDRNEIVFTKK